MRKTLTALLLLICMAAVCYAGQGIVSGQLMKNGDYYYIYLGDYKDSSSLQSQVYKAYPTQGGYAIWYNNAAWTLDTNKNGQHVTIGSENIVGSESLDSLIGETFAFNYLTDDQGIPKCSIFAGKKAWLVVILDPQSDQLQSVDGSTLHSSIGFNYSYPPSSNQ